MEFKIVYSYIYDNSNKLVSNVYKVNDSYFKFTLNSTIYVFKTFSEVRQCVNSIHTLKILPFKLF